MSHVMSHVRRGFGAGLAVGVAVVLGAGPAEAAGASWTVVAAPPSGGSAFLTSVSADRGSDAWAVGGPGRIADHWNGTSWQQTTVPVTTYVGSINMTAVSAASPTDAWAVGHGYSSSPAFHWDGHAWTEKTRSADWLSVADLGPGNAYFAGPGLLHWAGSSFTQPEFPDPGKPGTLTSGGNSGTSVRLEAISADAANDIWAVGTYTTNSTCSSCDLETFALHWNGTNWTDVPMPAVNRSTDPNLEYRFTSIDAISSSEVWAAGYTDDLGSTSVLGTLIEHWDGTRWSIVPAPSPGTSAALTGISGTSPTGVWAVGYDTPAGASGPQTLTLFWDGTSWTTIPSPNPDGPSQLQAATATPGSSTVWAVGLTGGADNPTNGVSGSPHPLALENS